MQTLTFSASLPVSLECGVHRLLACAVSTPKGPKCIAFVDAFAPVIDVPVDGTCDLVNMQCDGLSIHDEGEVVPLKSNVQLWRCSGQLVVIASTMDTRMAFSLNWWLRTRDRANALTSCLARLGCAPHRVRMNASVFRNTVQCITRATSTHDTPWMAAIAAVPFPPPILRSATCLPGYRFAYLPHGSAITTMPLPDTHVLDTRDDTEKLVDDELDTHVGDIVIHSESDEELAALFVKSMRAVRRAYPAGVFSGDTCCMCWGPGTNECVACFQFVLCNECTTALEGNCSQCLFVGQDHAADVCEARRHLHTS